MNVMSFFKGRSDTKDTNEFGIDVTPRKFAGEKVTYQTALALDTVHACIRDKSESIGQLPAVLKKDGKRINSGRVHRIFTQKPNDFQSMQDFLELAVVTLETRGNFYNEVKRNTNGSVYEIEPFFDPNGCQVNRDRGRIYYTGATNDGRIVNDSIEIGHLKQLSINGYSGESVITHNAKTIGVGLAQETHLDKVMNEGAVMKGYLSTDMTFKDNGLMETMRKAWKSLMRGDNKDGNTPILDQGMKFHNVTLSPADTELILQRKYSREQICGLFRVPPHRIGSTESQGYSSVEQNNIAYMRDSLIPIIRKIEYFMNGLLPDGYEWCLDESGFVRGDRRAQIETLEKELKSGAISLNEFRVGAGRDDIDGGDVHAIDTNNLTFGRLEDIQNLNRDTVSDDE